MVIYLSFTMQYEKVTGFLQIPCLMVLSIQPVL